MWGGPDRCPNCGHEYYSIYRAPYCGPGDVNYLTLTCKRCRTLNGRLWTDG